VVIDDFIASLSSLCSLDHQSSNIVVIIMSFPFTPFGRKNGSSSNYNNNKIMITPDFDDSCLFENSMHTSNHHHQYDHEDEDGTNIDMPPPPPVYPNKKLRVGSNDTNNNKNGKSSSTSTSGSNHEKQRSELNAMPVEEWNEGSPEEKDHQDNRKGGLEHKQGTTGEGEEEEEEPRESSEWNALVDEIQVDRDSVYCQDLQIWQDGVARRQHAEQCLIGAFQTCEKVLDTNVEFMIRSVAVPIHMHCHNTLTKRFQDIANSISSNHSRRQDLLKRLNDRNREWSKAYITLTARVQSKPVPNDGEQDQGHENIHPTIVDERTGESNKVDKEDGDVEEPNWETIAQEHESSRDNIRRLLQARDDMEAAEECFAMALQEIQAGLKECTATILQATVDLHQDAAERLDGRQVDIQEGIASNFRRNQQLEKAIEESAKQAQGVFSSLMARLKATAKSALSSGPGAATAAPRRK
jgi:hypothetical protein